VTDSDATPRDDPGIGPRPSRSPRETASLSPRPRARVPARGSSGALAGNAILSRAPFVRATNASVPAVRAKFGSSEQRLGRKRRVVAAIASEGHP
jgi:hypothetical protein